MMARGTQDHPQLLTLRRLRQKLPLLALAVTVSAEALAAEKDFAFSGCARVRSSAAVRPRLWESKRMSAGLL